MKQEKPDGSLRRLMEICHKQDVNKVSEMISATTFEMLKYVVSKMDEKEFELFIRVVCRFTLKPKKDETDNA